MSEIRVDHYRMFRNTHVYDLVESLTAAGYPRSIVPETLLPNPELAQRLAETPMGTGHDNFLCGIRVCTDMIVSAKVLIDLERYHWFDIVSCQGSLHLLRNARVLHFNQYTDAEILSRLETLRGEYRENPTEENAMRMLYSTPIGFEYYLRVSTNYRQLKTIYAQRKKHPVPELREICDWIRKLPCAELIVGMPKETAE